MHKSIRSFALAATLAFTATCPLNAEPMGTNPHPPTQPTSMLQIVKSTILAYFGL